MLAESVGINGRQVKLFYNKFNSLRTLANSLKH